MTDLVLDSWAVMAWLKNQQPEADRVRLLFEASARRECRLIMSLINLGEVFYLAVKSRGLAYGERVLDALRMRVKSISASDELVMAAALLKARYAISYADAFAAATALSQNAPLVTGDPELREMSIREPALKIDWIAGPDSALT